MTLGRRAMLGIVWAYGGFSAQRMLGLLTTAVLARILIPADFGLIAFVLLLLGLIDSFSDFGVKDALIYMSGPVDRARDTAFVLNAAIGFVLYVVVLVLAPLAALVSDDPRTVDILRVLALTIPLNALATTHDGLLQKAMEFRRFYLAELSGTVVKASVTLALAFAGLGIWSLVLGQLAYALSRTVSRWLTLKWLPRLRFSIAQARSLLGYGVHILAVRVLDIVLERPDQLLIAFLLGEVQLGFYYVAARIPEIAVASFNSVLTRVLFPTFANISQDRDRLTRLYLETTKYTALVVVPTGFGLAAVAPELVRVAFGTNWDASIGLLQVLSLVGVAASLPWSASDVFKATGRPDLITKLLLLESTYTLPLVVAAGMISRQALWVAAAYLVSLAVAAVIRLWLVRRLLGFPAVKYARSLWAPFAAGGMTAVVATAARLALEGYPSGAILCVSILAGAISYAGLIWLLAAQDVRFFVARVGALTANRASRAQEPV